MKLRINRETTIGLSVLLVLLVILGIVVVRRFMRPRVPFDEAVAKAEERHEEMHVEEPRIDHSKREADAFPRPALLTPVDRPHRDGLQSLDDSGHWNADLKEKRRETPTNSPASSLIASRPPAALDPPVNAELGRRDGERKTTYSPSEGHPTAADDRYAAAGPELSAERRIREGDRSMVIQVSDGETVEHGPRPVDRYADGERRDHPVQPGPGAAARDGMAVDPEAARLHAEKAREHDREAARGYESTPAPSNRYDPNYSRPAGGAPSYYSGAPTGNAASNYSADHGYMAPAGGYSPDNSLRPGGEIPGSMPARNPLRGDGKYEVQPNDSFWTISERVYGSGAYFRALAEQNRGKAARPDRLPPGLVISTPPVAQLEKDYPDLCPRPNRRETVRNRADLATRDPHAGAPGYAASLAGTAGGGRTYIVQEGDTLSSIARNELGKVSRWAEIYQINREALGKDYDYLTPGMRLVLPIRDSAPGDRTTRRSEGDVPLLR